MVGSAGTQSPRKLNEKAVAVLKEIGIDISHTSDSADLFLNEEWDYIITVYVRATQASPAFIGKV